MAMAKVSKFIGIIVLTSVWKTLLCFTCSNGTWGDACENKCLPDCVTCTQDSVDGGLPCTSCVPGKHSGRLGDYDNWQYYDDCRFNCTEKCASCTTWYNCTECVNGSYGLFCQRNCYSGCEGGACDKLDGQCKCKTGDASRFCEGQLSCTDNPCGCCRNNKCETNNGNYCSDGCLDGYWGNACDNICHPDCVACTRNSVDGGLPCTSCAPGKYSGHRKWYNDDCRYNCSSRCKLCTSPIDCTECVSGRYGTDCQYDCYSGCKGGVCDQMDGQCTCETGNASHFCKSKPLCTNNHCKNNICDINNDNYCTYGCSNGRWGQTCENICPVNCVTCTQESRNKGLPCTSCMSGKYIDRQSGRFSIYVYSDCRDNCKDKCVACTSINNCTECIDGQYGSDCNSTCSNGCEGGICSKTNGSCPCVNGRYGIYCDDYCSPGCEGGICSKTDGSCSCVNGRYGTYCDVYCPSGCEGGICSKRDGSCSCVNGRYGTHCDDYCYPGCKGGKCSKTDGSCSCVNGRYGTYCDVYCPSGCEGGICSKSDGSCPGDKTWLYIIVAIVIAGLIIVAIIAHPYGIYVKLTPWLTRKCHIRRAVTSTEDNRVENNETEHDTRRESVEMAILNENRDTKLVTSNIQNESKQESNEDPAKIALQSDNAEMLSHHELVHTRQPIPQLQSIQGEDDWTLIGEQIYYDHNKLIGTGSMSAVYEGRYGSEKYKKIAVKKIMCANNVEATTRCKEIAVITRLMEPSRDPHIVDFIHSYTNVNTVYIAFELGKGTLVDFVKDSNEEWRVRLGYANANRGLSEGLSYIHSKGIVHRDLKPQNIFIVERNAAYLKAVIGDFGSAKATAGSMYSLTGRMGSVGYIAPEIWTAMCQDPTAILGKLCNRKSDIFALGLILYYTISLGDNAFGHDITAQSTIQKGEKPTIAKLNQIRNSYAHQVLIEYMLKAKPEERPGSDTVVLHPANWTDIQTIRYLAVKSDEIEQMIKTDPSNVTVLEDPWLIPNRNWMNRLPVDTKTYLKQYRINRQSPPLYIGKETNVRSLLRVIRNTNSHHKEYPQNVQVDLGDYPEGHVDMWLRVCPKLLMHVVEKLGLP